MESIQSPIYVTIGPEKFRDKIKSDDVLVVDVRQPEEFEAGHLENAVNIDVKDEGFLKIAVNTLPKDKVIAVYCRSGKRSALASEMLSKKGYKVLNLDGGIENWISHNYPVVK